MADRLTILQFKNKVEKLDVETPFGSSIAQRASAKLLDSMAGVI